MTFNFFNFNRAIKVDGTGGNDTRTYNLTNNRGRKYEYDGEGGFDTLRFEFTLAQWLEPGIQTDIARYRKHLADGKSKHDFKFNAFDLKVEEFETFKIFVGGVELSIADDGVTAVNDSYAIGENGVLTANVVSNDTVPDLVRKVELVGTAPAGLTFRPDGSFTYNPGTAFDYLKAGQSAIVTFQYKVFDADADTGIATASITIAGANDAAEIGDAPNTAVKEDVAVNGAGQLVASGTIAISDKDAGEAKFLTATTAAAGNLGTLTLTTTGAYTYSVANAATQSLAAGETKTDSFTVEAHDGTKKTISFTIAGTNDKPVFAGSELVMNGGFSDGAAAWINNAGRPVETNPGSIYGVTTTGNGRVLEIDVDGGGALDIISQTIATVAGQSYTFSFDSARRAGTSAATNAFEVLWNGTAIGTVTPTSTTLTANSFTVLALGASSTLAFREIGGTGGVNNDSVGGIIDNVSVVANAMGAVTEQTTPPAGSVTTSGTIAFTDVDTTDVHTVSAAKIGTTLGNLIASQATDTATGGSVGWTYNVAASAIEFLAAGQTKVESFIITLNDGKGGIATKQVDITITGTNDAPVVTGPVTGTATEDGTAVALLALANASDVDAGATLSVVPPAILPPGVTYDAAAKSFVLDPGDAAYQSLKLGATTTVTVGYGISDGTATTPASVSWTVTGTNDGPVAVADDDAVVEAGVNPGDTAFPGEAIAAGNVLLNDTDVDVGDSKSVLAVNGSAANVGATLLGTYGTLVLLADGGYVYTLDNDNPLTQALAQDAIVTEVFSYTVEDGEGATSNATLTISVIGTNDAPVLAVALEDQAAPEDVAFSFTIPADSFTDIDSAALTYSATLEGGDPLPAWLTFNAATGTFSGTPADADVGVLQVRVTASDGSASASDVFQITVETINDAPVVSMDVADQTATEDAPFTFTLPANAFSDGDGDALALSAAGLPGWLSFDELTGTFSGTPTNGDVGSVTVTVTATDPDGETASQEIVFTVANTNDAPTVTMPPVPDQTVLSGTAFTYALPADAFADVDVGDILTLSSTGQPAGITFDAASGTFSGSATADFIATVRATDLAGASVTQNIKFDIVAPQPVQLFSAYNEGDGTGTLKGSFATIQAAVDAADDDDAVVIAGGTYVEQLVVEGIDNLRILEAPGADVVIEAPALLAVTGASASFGDAVRSVVTVKQSSNVTIKGVTIDGAFAGDTTPGSNGDELSGIAYLNASGTVDGVAVQNVSNSPTAPIALFGLQHGSGIFFDAGRDPADQLTFTLTNSTVTDFQKTGVLILNADLTMTDNIITGIGATGITAQNGLQLGRSEGTVAGNAISGVSYIVPAGGTEFYASNAIVYEPTGNITIFNNSFTSPVAGLSAGIDLSDVEDPAIVTIANNTFDGVDYGLYGYSYDGTIGLGSAPVLSNNIFLNIGINGLYIDPEETVLPPVFTTNTPFVLSGTQDADVLRGSNGNDVLAGNGGDDELAGRAGNDRFIHTVGDGNDRVDGGIELGSTFPDYDVLEINGNGTNETFTIGTALGGDPILPAANEIDILVSYAGGSVRADEVEGIAVNLTVGDTLVVGDVTGTAILGTTIVVTTSGGNTVDLGDLDGTTVRISGTGTNTVLLAGALADYEGEEGEDGSFTISKDGAPVLTVAGADGLTFTDEAGESGGIDDLGGDGGGENRAPVAVNDQDFEVGINDGLSVGASGVLGNDTDPDRDDLTAVPLDNVATIQNGRVTLNENGSFEYQAPTGFVGADSFQYFVNDGTTNSATPATVTINVLPDEDDFPLANDQTAPLSFEEGDGANASGNLVEDDVGFRQLSVTDVTAGGGDIVASAVLPAEVVAGGEVEGIYGTLTWQPNGDYEYVLNIQDPDTLALEAGAEAFDRFTYTVQNRFGDDQGVLTIALQVLSGDDPTPPADDDIPVASLSVPVEQTAFI